MESQTNRSIMLGSFFGFIFSIIVAVTVNLLGDNFEIIQRIGLYIGSVPAYFASKTNNHDVFVTIAFIIYWILIGGVFGFILNLKVSTAKTIMFIAIIVLILIHYLAMAQLSKEIGEAIRALGDVF